MQPSSTGMDQPGMLTSCMGNRLAHQLAGINIENTSPQKTVKELYAWYTALPHGQDKIPLIGNPELELVT